MTLKRGGRWLVLIVGAAFAIGASAIVQQAPEPPVANSFYVALGSSFAAGVGLGDRAPGSSLVSQRSSFGYPQQLARLLKVPSFTDVTSSGSTVVQVLHGGQTSLGPQIDALGPDTRLVTITAGGNDVQYIGDLLMIASMNHSGSVGNIAQKVWKQPRPANQRNFEALRANLKETLLEVMRRSPRARIVVVTYPAVLPASGTCMALGITEQQAALMRPVADRLAAIMRDAAANAGATTVDMAMLSAGHDACSADPWVNGSRPTLGAAFHPTMAGARATAEAIAEAITRKAH